MKKAIVFLILSSCFPLISNAYSGRCDYNNVEVTIRCSNYEISPKTVYVRQNDTVCINFESADQTPQTLLIQSHPLYLKARAGQSDRGGLYAKKIGSYKISCGMNKAELIVQSGAEFDKKEEEFSRVDSHFNRKSFPKKEPVK